MAQPEIIKDIEARIIRPSSTDNAIVRFNGATGLVQNSTPLIYDNGNIILPTNSGTLYFTNTNNYINSSSYTGASAYMYLCGGRVTDLNVDTNVYPNRIWWIYNSSTATANRPPHGDGMVLNMSWDWSSGYAYQLSFGGWKSPHLAIRGSSNNSSNKNDWGNWYTVLDSGNYNLYTPTKTGGGASGTWGISISGNAATATNADKLDGYHASLLWRSDGGVWNPSANISLSASANSQEWSFDIRRNGYTGCYWHVWDSEKHSLLLVKPDDGKVYAPYGFVGNLEGVATSATKATLDGNGNIITSTYLPLSGGTMSGRINLPYNTFSLQFRSSGDSIDSAYNTGTYYGTLGNECLAFVARLTVTSFMFVTGSDPATWTSDTWNSSSPALLIKGQSVYVNSLIVNGVSPSYNFYVNGTSYFNGIAIAATMFKGDTSEAGIRPLSSNEINFSSNGSTIWFGYRTIGSNAVSVYNFGNSAGSATGTINAGTVYGAVWNDYAEFRSSDPIEPGRVICETGDGTLKLSTERLQPGANVVSDTFGFAIGETENCKTPIAVSGRALVYTYEDRYSYAAGDPVCAGPSGTVSKMSREEVMMYPDRIVGTVSEIPEYERWGTGNVEVKNRIWIKVK